MPKDQDWRVSGTRKENTYASESLCSYREGRRITQTLSGKECLNKLDVNGGEMRGNTGKPEGDELWCIRCQSTKSEAG